MEASNCRGFVITAQPAARSPFGPFRCDPGWQAKWRWSCLGLVVLCFAGCRDGSAVLDSPAGVRGTSPPAEAPAPMTEQAMLEALRSGQPPAAAERFLEAVRVIDAVEGQLRFDQDGRLIALDLSRDRTSIDAGQLHALAVFPHVRRLRLAGSNLDNAQLRWIAERWNALQELGLHHAGIDDEGLQTLDQFEGLSILSLRALAGLSDAGLETIAGLPQLEQLFLVDNRITGRGLASLVALTHLQVLDIRGCTAIAADDLRPLADCRGPADGVCQDAGEPGGRALRASDCRGQTLRPLRIAVAVTPDQFGVGCRVVHGNQKSSGTVKAPTLSVSYAWLGVERFRLKVHLAKLGVRATCQALAKCASRRAPAVPCR